MEFKFATEVLDAVAVFNGAFVGDIVWASDNAFFNVVPNGALAVISATATGTAIITATVTTKGGATVVASAEAIATVADADAGTITLTVRVL